MRKKNTIRLNESMLHRIIKESVKNVLNEMDEATNGWTERAFRNLQSDWHEVPGKKHKQFNNGSRYNSSFGSEGDPTYNERKKRALDYLGDRWQRENNYSDDAVNRISRYSIGAQPNFEDSDLTSSQLRRLGQQSPYDLSSLSRHQQKRK